MFRSARPEKDESGSDWDDDSSEVAPVTKAPSTPDKSKIAAPLQQLKKPSSVQDETSSIIQPPRKVNAEIQFTNIEQEHTRDRDTPFAAKADYRIAKEQSAQTEPRHFTETMISEHGPDTVHVEQMDPQLVLTRSSSGFSFITVGDDNVRQLVLDHHAVESVMGEYATRAEKKYRRCAAELFSTLRIVSDCLIVFLLECAFYSVHHVCYKLFCGMATLVADAVCKPGIPACFNSVLWPLYMLAWKMNRSTKLCLGPCIELLGAIATHCATVARACRLVQVDTNRKTEHV